MNTLIPVVIGALVITALCEAILWWLFRKKIAPLSFPHELDTSYFRFFSVPRLRMTAILHTLFTAACIVLCCWYLW